VIANNAEERERVAASTLEESAAVRVLPLSQGINIPGSSTAIWNFEIADLKSLIRNPKYQIEKRAGTGRQAWSAETRVIYLISRISDQRFEVRNFEIPYTVDAPGILTPSLRRARRSRSEVGRGAT
jgi:hypothetical protein